MSFGSAIKNLASQDKSIFSFTKRTCVVAIFYLVSAHVASATLLSLRCSFRSPLSLWSPSKLCEFKGVVGASRNYTDDEILKLRQAGMNAPIEIDGRLFLAGTRSCIVKALNTTCRAVAALTRNIETVRKQFESNTIAKPLLQRVCQSPGTPVKLRVRMEAGQMILYDKNRSLAIMVLMQVEGITTQNR
jgi:hypothetical protein